MWNESGKSHVSCRFSLCKLLYLSVFMSNKIFFLSLFLVVMLIFKRIFIILIYLVIFSRTPKSKWYCSWCWTFILQSFSTVIGVWFPVLLWSSLLNNSITKLLEHAFEYICNDMDALLFLGANYDVELYIVMGSWMFRNSIISLIVSISFISVCKLPKDHCQPFFHVIFYAVFSCIVPKSNKLLFEVVEMIS